MQFVSNTWLLQYAVLPSFLSIRYFEGFRKYLYLETETDVEGIFNEGLVIG